MRCYQEKYIHFGGEEFAADEYFQQWVLLPDKQSDAFWQSYLQGNPQQRKTIKEARKLVSNLTTSGFHVPFLSDHEKRFLKSVVYRELGFPDPIEPFIKKAGSSTWKWWSVAAAAILLFFTGFLFWNNANSSRQPYSIVKEHTEPKKIREILLPDSTVVILNGGSSIQYSSNFSSSNTREVKLIGNAYFNVSKTKQHTPFIVHTNEVDIKVTGTEFNVNAHTKATDIVLTSGNLNVALHNNASKTALMQAGQALTLDTVKQDFITTPVNTELYTAAWKEKEWHFNETSLETIAVFIKEYYGVDVVFENSRSKQLMVTAVISTNNFQTLVSILEKTLNINIQVHSQQLTIH
jgi:transmembrane sensor